MHSIVIVGAGQAGLQTAESLRKAGFAGSLAIIDQTEDALFQKPPLSKAYLAGDVPEERLRLRPTTFFQSHRIDAYFGVKVVAIQRQERCVQLSDGATLAYDRLIMATGARARSIDAFQDVTSQLHVIRDLSDAKRLRERLTSIDSVAVIGGGFLGLECASTLRKLGKSVIVIEQQSRLLARVASPPISEFLHRTHVASGVEIRLQAVISTIERVADTGRLRVVFEDHSACLVDECVVAIGVITNSELAQTCGLMVDGGIVTDQNGQTSDPNIYAVGDVATFHHSHYQRRVRLESIDNAFEQARSLAKHLCAHETTHHKIPWFWSDQYEHKLLMAGLAAPTAHWVVRGDPHTGSFTVGAFEGDRLVAIECMNEPKQFAKFRKLMNNKDIISKSVFLNPDSDADPT